MKKARRKRNPMVECPNCLWRELLAIVVTLTAVGAFYVALLNGVFGITD